MTNRLRVWVTLSVLSLAACTGRGTAPPELPKSISPGWRLTNFAHVGDEWRGTYTGPGTAHVRIAAIGSQAVGLDRIQHFRAGANSIAFYGDHYFTTVTWDTATTEEARALIKTLEATLN